jgi:hypothetical protein
MNRHAEPEAVPIPSIALPSDQTSVDTATLDLLASWRVSDATNSPDQILAAEQELSEFKSALNQNRIATNDPVLYL